MKITGKFFLILAFFLGATGARAQIINTLIGNCTGNYTGDGGPSTLANLCCPDDLAFDPQGNLYIADPGNCVIRKVAAGTSIISTYAGAISVSGGVTTGVCGFSGDGGPAAGAELYFPSGIAVDSQGNLYIADFYNDVIREVNASTGIITTFAGTYTTMGVSEVGVYGYLGDGGPATQALMADPNIVRFNPSGTGLFVSDAGNDTVREINMSTGIITTVAGNGTLGYSGDGGPATLASMNQPEAMAWDAQGNLYVSDTTNGVIREVNTSGIISTIAGTGVTGYSGDGGPATLAQLSDDVGSLYFTCNGNLVFPDDDNNRIRILDMTTGIITTVMGTGVAGCSSSGTSVLSTNLDHPEVLIKDPSGNLLLADYGNSLVQEVVGGLCPITPTPSNTLTATPSNTATRTATPTPTFTPTNTPTVTSSPTPTASFTPTPTPTNSGTPTPTNTPTLSPTPSATSTPTSTPTITPTPTPTFTSTPSPTPTWGLSLGKRVSATTAQSGDLLAYTLSVTLTTGDATGVVITDSLPAGVSFVGPGPSLPPALPTPSYNAGTHVLSWVMPSPLSAGVYSLAYQVQVEPLAPAGTNLINAAQLAYPGIPSPLSASVTVGVLGNETVQIGVYNESGELIKTLRVFRTSQGVDNLTLQGNSITSLNGPNDQIGIYYQGILLATWDGLDASGNPVSNGAYFIKMDSIDPAGVVSSVTQEATVSRNLAKVSAVIYNESGEAVKHLTAWVDDANGAPMTNLFMSRAVLQAGATGPGQPGSVQIQIQTQASSVTLSWDGTNDAGSLVTAGNYLFSVDWYDGNGGHNVITKALLVTPGDRNNGGIVALPNLLLEATGQTKITFSDTSSQNSTLGVRIYAVSGELVASFQGNLGTGQAAWDASGLASGLYLAMVEKLGASGGALNRQILKFMVVH